MSPHRDGPCIESEHASATIYTCHTGEGRYPWQRWIPAFAGMTFMMPQTRTYRGRMKLKG